MDLHLCDYKGIPMHAVENGFYHLREGFNEIKPDNKLFKGKFCEYYRITSEQFDILNDSENKIQYALHLQDIGILKQWEEQANKAISLLEEMTGKKFLVDSKRTQFNAPTLEEIQEENQKQASGYYTQEAKVQREKERIADLHAKIDKEWNAKIIEVSTEFTIKKRVLDIGGEAALKNYIYYTHSKTLAFNWKGSDKISDELIQHIKNNIILPDGVKIETKG